MNARKSLRRILLVAALLGASLIVDARVPRRGVGVGAPGRPVAGVARRTTRRMHPPDDDLRGHPAAELQHRRHRRRHPAPVWRDLLSAVRHPVRRRERRLSARGRARQAETRRPALNQRQRLSAHRRAWPRRRRRTRLGEPSPVVTRPRRATASAARSHDHRARELAIARRRTSQFPAAGTPGFPEVTSLRRSSNFRIAARKRKCLDARKSCELRPAGGSPPRPHRRRARACSKRHSERWSWSPRRRRCSKAAARLRPDVAVVDLSLAQESGLGWLRRLRQRCPGLQVIVLSVHDEPSVRRAALEAGADAFVLKRAIVTDLLPAVDRLRDAIGSGAPGNGSAAVPATEERKETR